MEWLSAEWSIGPVSSVANSCKNQWCSTRVWQCARVHIFKDSDSDLSPFLRTRTRMQRTWTRTLRTRTRALRAQSQTQCTIWPMMLSHITSYIESDSMFKKIQCTFSICFLSSSYSVSVEYQCLFSRPGTVGTVALSGLHNVTNWHWSHWLVLHASWTGEMFIWPHRAGLSNELELWFSLS